MNTAISGNYASTTNLMPSQHSSRTKSLPQNVVKYFAVFDDIHHRFNCLCWKCWKNLSKQLMAALTMARIAEWSKAPNSSVVSPEFDAQQAILVSLSVVRPDPVFDKSSLFTN